MEASGAAEGVCTRAAGEVVWAKVPGFPFWPARIAAESEVAPSVRALKSEAAPTLVHFFGSRDYAWLRERQLCDWSEGYAKHSKGKASKRKLFMRGMAEAVDWKRSPQQLPVWREEPAIAPEGIKRALSERAKSRTERPEPREERKEDGDECAGGVDEDGEHVPLPVLSPEELEERINSNPRRRAALERLGLCAPQGAAQLYAGVGGPENLCDQQKLVREPGDPWSCYDEMEESALEEEAQLGAGQANGHVETGPENEIQLKGGGEGVEPNVVATENGDDTSAMEVEASEESSSALGDTMADAIDDVAAANEGAASSGGNGVESSRGGSSSGVVHSLLAAEDAMVLE